MPGGSPPQSRTFVASDARDRNSGRIVSGGVILVIAHTIHKEESA
jgi:hypothetical protein